MNATITIRKFPRGMGAMPLTRIARRRARGVGDGTNTVLGTIGDELVGIDPITGALSPTAGIDQIYNMATGSLDTAQQSEIAYQNAQALQQAATSPTTGQVNDSLYQSELLQMLGETPTASDVSNVSTGSYLANAVDAASGNYTQPLGYPGTTPALGSTAANPVQTVGQFLGTVFGENADGTWSFPWGTAALIAALALGGYLIYENLI